MRKFYIEYYFVLFFVKKSKIEYDFIIVLKSYCITMSNIVS